MVSLPADQAGGLVRSLPPESYLPDVAGAEFIDWFARCSAAAQCRVTRAPLTELRKWRFDAGTGNLAHESGAFFAVEGLRVRTGYGPVREWSQPIINQPEIGILGMLVKEIDGVPHCLVQAKIEPGNHNRIQLSPTVQATRSNYTRIHQGRSTRYLEFFTQPGAGRTLVDVLQSEQGAWFLRKRNRNMVVQVAEDVPAAEGYHWLQLTELRRLLRIDGLVNMDTRTVLACLPADAFPASRPVPVGDVAAALVLSSTGQGPSLNDTGAVLRWFTGAKSRHELTAHRTPLNALPGWHSTPEQITHEDGRHFSIIGVTAQVGNREVAEWDQPLLSPKGRGIVAFVIKVIEGVAHLLVHARFQPGLMDGMEMGPTVQCVPENYPQGPPRFLDYVLTAPRERLLYSAVLAEEGGRFYHSQNSYLLVEADDDFPVAVPEDYCWLTAHQLTRLLRHGYYVNVEARSLLACLQSW
ncbi:NDP-hexose 2,3-dehydratase family protein [Streptomyces sp. NPDC059010]|uniref:NDP-hexose 2,3-dehydratase family protein n=1 Tax=Streptomyces sp. NPDC059010 TaxID=3346695 RepID=UPI0036C9AFF5